jgi:hypothetical protein
MRVLLHQGHQGVIGARAAIKLSDMMPGHQVATLVSIAAGKFCLLPDGCIAEPAEVFDRQEDAHSHRDQLAREYPSEDFRVVLNSSVSI